jgi:hypothetical protein
MPASTGSAEQIGLFIDAWSDNVVEAFRNLTPVLADMPMTQAELVGGVYHQPVRLSFEAGQTFAPASPPSGTGASIIPGVGRTYVGPRAGYVGDAQIRGMQIHGRTAIPYEAIARSASSVNASLSATDRKKAVRGASKTALEGLMMGTLKKAEALLLHGGEGLGQGEAIAGSTSQVVATAYEGVPGFAIDISISPGTWSEAIWTAFEGHTFDLFNDAAGAGGASGVPGGTRLNTAANTLLNAGVSQTGVVLIAVNPATPLAGFTAAPGRVLRFWHSSGTAGAPGTGVLGGWATSATAGNNNIYVCFESAGPGVEFVGLGLCAASTGTLFNVDGAAYSVYRGNVVSNAGNLRLSALVRGLSRALNKGAQGKRLRAVVPTELFAQFANDESTLRRYASTTGSAENGFESIQMYLPHGAILEVLGHGLQKDGRVLCYVPEDTKRIGSQDLQMVTPDGQSGREALTLHLANQPSGEVRLFGQYAPFPATPGHMTLFTGVTF